MIQLIQQWKTSTTCIGQSFQTFFRKYIGCPGIKNEEGRRGQGTSRKEKWQGIPGINQRAISAHPGEKLSQRRDLPLLYGKELGSRLSSKSYMLKRETL